MLIKELEKTGVEWDEDGNKYELLATNSATELHKFHLWHTINVWSQMKGDNLTETYMLLKYQKGNS